MSDNHEDIDEPVDDDAFDALVAQLPDALRDPAVWAEPPPWLADSIVAAIADERAEAGPVVAATAAPARTRRQRRPRQTWWLAAAAAVVAHRRGRRDHRHARWWRRRGVRDGRDRSRSGRQRDG